MSNPTAPPEAQEYLIWSDGLGWWAGSSYTHDPNKATRYSRDDAKYAERSFLEARRAVPLSQALESGPPVEAQEPTDSKLYGFDVVADPAVPKGEAWVETPTGETFRVAFPVEPPEERTRRELAALPVPVPGETWHCYDGSRVRIERTWHDGDDLIIEYRWYIYESLHSRTELRTLRSWYGFERPGVRRFQRERPEPTYPCKDCGKLRTEAEGGTTFTVCDECWDKTHKPKREPTTPPDYQADVRAFHEALVPDQVADMPTMPSEQVLKLRRKLIREECGELIDALEDRDMVRAVDGAGDAMYVILGTLVAMGVDLAPVWREIQRSNMAKAGGPVRADGKLLKPEGWTPPDVRGELERQGWSDPARESATAIQPRPNGKGREVTPLVIADLEARTRIGTEKYGEPLRAFNGRDALVDAYQEALDLAQYLKQAIEERGGEPPNGGGEDGE